MNLYEFEDSGPLNQLDPSGHMPQAIVAMLGGAAVGGIVGAGISFFSGDDMDTVAAKGAIGAIAGGVGGLLAGLGVPPLAVSAIVSAIDAALSKAWELYKQAVDRGCKPDWDKILERAFMAGIEGAIMGLVSGGMGAIAGKLLSKLNICGKMSKLAGRAICPGVQFATNIAVGVASGAATDAVSELVTPEVDTPCFVEGTPILVKGDNGELAEKPVEEVKAGDYVYSRDEATGEQGYKQVTRTFVKQTDVLVHLAFRRLGSRTRGFAGVAGQDGGDADKGDGLCSLTGTPEHPFWSLTRKNWVGLGELRKGEIILLADGEAVVKYSRNEHLDTPTTVYNVEVEGWHTYFACDSWVHNACGPAKTLDKRGNWHDAAGRFAKRPPPAGSLQASKMRQVHIIHGDVPKVGGGGHAARATVPGKSRFPGSMSDADIIKGVERIANNPASYPGGRMPVGNSSRSRYTATGSISGESRRVRVIVEPLGEGIITAHPN